MYRPGGSCPATFPWPFHLFYEPPCVMNLPAFSLPAAIESPARASHYPVIVIGGGPAGSVAVTRLARHGQPVLVLEKEQFPRFHIGESLLPNGNRILREIGVWDKVAAAGFIEKRGAQFTLADRSRSVRNVFAQGWVPGLDMAYQVERATFDEILLRHAQACGAQVWEQTSVSNASPRQQGGWQLTIDGPAGRQTLTADWVIDASGRHSVIGRSLKLPRTPLPYPGRVAVFNHFRGVNRDDGEAAGDVIITRLDDAWFWSIPLADGITSVGVVLHKGAGKRTGETLEQVFWRKVNEAPFMRSALTGAQAIGDYRQDSDYSFSFATFGVQRALLAGDAASFIDPIFSSGVYLALESGLLAADHIHQYLRRPGSRASEQRMYARYTGALNKRIGFMRELIDIYYDNDACEVFMSPRPALQLPQAINSILAGKLNPDWAVRWRLWLFRQICALHKRRTLIPKINWRDPRSDNPMAQ